MPQFIEEYKKANSDLDAETLYAEIASLRILENVEVPGAPKKAEPVKVRGLTGTHKQWAYWISRLVLKSANELYQTSKSDVAIPDWRFRSRCGYWLLIFPSVHL